MSFMFNPHPYDDPTAVNRPKLSEEIVDSVLVGNQVVGDHIAELVIDRLELDKNTVILALEGYIGAQWKHTINLVSQKLKLNSIKVTALNIAELFKSAAQLDNELLPFLEEDREKDPVLLFGKLFSGSFDNLFDADKVKTFKSKLKKAKASSNNEVVIVYGCGSTISSFRELYDLIFYYDVSPKQVILRARKGAFANLGDTTAKPIKALLRRCYYIDFELAGRLRKDLIKNNAIDYYVDNNNSEDLKLIPKESFNSITTTLATYPVRCKPVYSEGVWGGHFISRLRNLPKTMRNCAWVFDLIPLEVSLVVEVGKQMLELPFFTFVQKQGEAIMGKECVDKFGGYFPIRVNYDDTFHSTGNMSIQLHSGDEYNKENYNELGRQDESYYVVATGHDAKTFVGFNDGINADDFVNEVKKSEKENKKFDYEKYIGHVKSNPGLQLMLPAGTIHASGQNQVILEIGSLTVGSYTYKMYDYCREDFDGKPRPIHSMHGEKVLRKNTDEAWVKENLNPEPKLVRNGADWAEYIVGEHDLLYFSLRRLEFEKSIEDETKGIFHILTLVDGERVIVQSLSNPELSYTLNFLDVIVVPAIMGKYVIKNLGGEPVCVHKTILKDGFVDDGISYN